MEQHTTSPDLFGTVAQLNNRVSDLMAQCQREKTRADALNAQLELTNKRLMESFAEQIKQKERADAAEAKLEKYYEVAQSEQTDVIDGWIKKCHELEVQLALSNGHCMEVITEKAEVSQKLAAAMRVVEAARLIARNFTSYNKQVDLIGAIDEWEVAQ